MRKERKWYGEEVYFDDGNYDGYAGFQALSFLTGQWRKTTRCMNMIRSGTFFLFSCGGKALYLVSGSAISFLAWCCFCLNRSLFCSLYLGGKGGLLCRWSHSDIPTAGCTGIPGRCNTMMCFSILYGTIVLHMSTMSLHYIPWSPPFCYARSFLAVTSISIFITSSNSPACTIVAAGRTSPSHFRRTGLDVLF